MSPAPHLRWFCLLFALWATGVRAQHFASRVYTEDDGMPSTQVTDIAQDARGFMWFAGRMGLSRYDGARWRHFDPAGVRFDRIVADERGGIYAARRDKVPLYYCDGATVRPVVTADDPPTVEFPFGMEVMQWEGRAVPALLLGDKGLYLVIDGALQRPPAPLPEQADLIYAFENKLYVVDAGVVRVLGPHGWDTREVPLPPDFGPVRGMAAEAGQHTPVLWLLGMNRLGTLVDTVYTERARIAPGSTAPAALLTDDEGGLFFGSETELFHFQPDVGTRALTAHGGFAGEAADAMMRDREGNIWVAGPRGVTKLGPRRFVGFCDQDGLLQREVTALAEIQPGVLVVGHNSGFSLWEYGRISHVSLTRPSVGSRTRVMDLAVRTDGSLWAACSNLGLVKVGVYEGKDGLRAFVAAHRSLPSPENQAYALCDAGGTLWVGTAKGLYRLREDRLEAVSPQNTLAVRRLLRARDGTLYAAVETTGLNVVTPEGLVPEPGWTQTSGELYTLLEDRLGRLILGTLNGLFLRTEAGILPYRKFGEGVDRPVYMLVEDGEGQLWAGTDRGLVRFGRENVRRYTIREGLAGNETNRDAGLVDTRGRLWVGTDQGLSRFRRQADFVPRPPAVVHGPVEVGGMVMHPELLTDLAPDENDLTFPFHVLGYADEGSTRFSYRLEGYDTVWSPPRSSSERMVRYTNLGAGTYRLHVKAAQADGAWSEPVAGPPVTITRAFRHTWWFRLVLLAVALAVAYSAVGYLTAKRQSQDLEAQVRRRTHELETKVLELEHAQMEISTLNAQLEARVEARTAQLKAAQKDLVETAHRAGMAEIATAVLHNVGNVLNSLGTSGFLLKDTLDKSVVGAFQSANTLLRSHMDDLPRFVSEDPRGPRLFAFYLSLEERLLREHGVLHEHMNQFLEKLDVVKDVVAQQHNYASGVFQAERLDLQPLVESALKIMATALESRDVAVETQFEPVPAVRVRKTRTVHILVNLIKNAMESMETVHDRPRRLRLELTGEADHVFLRVSDTGAGIGPEVMTRLFRHGFTTKTRGMGFGLHSCANAMKEMDGAIWAEHAAGGPGAVFVLKFPVPQESGTHPVWDGEPAA